MMTQLTERPPSLGLLAGGPDPDADTRAALRGALPLHPPRDDPRACLACWAAAGAERQQLGRANAAHGGMPAPGPDDCLCEQHLRDAALAPDGSASDVLAWQARRQAARLAQVLDARPRRLGIFAGWLSARSRSALAAPGCPVCRSRDLAGSQETGRLQVLLRAERVPAPGRVRVVRAARGRASRGGWASGPGGGRPAERIRRPAAE